MEFPSVAVVVALVGVGLVIGVISGMVGIGGGVLVIPVLVMFFGFTQVKANGTSLAMLLPPIGIFAVLSYWRAGNVEMGYAMWLAVGFAAGAWLGAVAVGRGWVHPGVLRVMFALLLLYIAGRMLLPPGGRVRALGEVLLVAVGLLAVVVGLGKWLGRRYPKMAERMGRGGAEGHDYEI